VTNRCISAKRAYACGRPQGLAIRHALERHSGGAGNGALCVGKGNAVHTHTHTHLHGQATRHTATRCDQLIFVYAAGLRGQGGTACFVCGGACARERALTCQSFLGVKPRASISAFRFAFMRLTVFRTVAFGSDRAHRFSRARNASLVSLPVGSHSAIFASICVHNE
jgi:hypothetical protein